MVSSDYVFGRLHYILKTCFFGIDRIIELPTVGISYFFSRLLYEKPLVKMTVELRLSGEKMTKMTPLPTCAAPEPHASFACSVILKDLMDL